MLGRERGILVGGEEKRGTGRKGVNEARGKGRE